MLKRYFIFVTNILLASTFSAPAFAQNASFERIFTFGNSRSDIGNLFNLNGGSFPPSPLYNNGRFSDGSIWIEDLTEDLGLNPSTFYGNPVTDLGEGLNFAIGGATSGTTTLADTSEFSFPGVTTQVNDFISLLNGSTISEDALVVVWVGENDYVESVQNSGTLVDPTVPVNNIANSLTQLANAGAKNVLVSNLVDLRDIPLAQELIPPEQLEGLSLLTTAHNNLLNGAIDSLSTSFPETNFTIFDVNSVVENIIDDPTAFGFGIDPLQSCLSPNSFPNIDPNVVSCDDPDRFIYFDNQHYTNAVHQLIADDALQTINANFSSADSTTPIPESRNVVALMTIGLGLLSGFVKKVIKS